MNHDFPIFCSIIQAAPHGNQLENAELELIGYRFLNYVQSTVIYCNTQ